MFSSVLSRLRTKRQHGQKPTPKVDHTQSASALCRLPAELLLVISDTLPLSSQVCLTLTCKKIYLSLGNKCTATLQTKDRKDDERKRFLYLLSKDCPLLLPCFLCMKLHRQERLLQKNKCSDYAGSVVAFRDFHRFRYAHIQLFMGLHDVPARHNQLSQIPRTERKFLTAIKHPVRSDRWRTRTVSELRVVGQRLLLRVQLENVDILIGMWKWNFSARKFLSMLEGFGCCHGDYHGSRSGPAVFPLLLNAYHFCRTTTSSTIHRENSVLRRCFYCATETEFSVEVPKGERSSFTITYWMDLGSGKDSTEDTWRSHLRRIRAEYKPEPSSQQSIKEAFEGSDTSTPSQRTPHLSIVPFPPHGSLSTDVCATEFLLRIGGD